MLKDVQEIQNRIAFFIDSTPREQWEAWVCDDLKPRMERLKIRYNNKYVVSLHRTFPCSVEEACFHTHPAPMFVKLYKGKYELSLGYGKEQPPICTRSVLVPGATYSMELPHTWHYHRSLSDFTLTLAIEAENFLEPQFGQPDPAKKLRPLSDIEKDNLFSEFMFSVHEHLKGMRPFDQPFMDSLLYLSLAEANAIADIHSRDVAVAAKDGLAGNTTNYAINVELMQDKRVKAWWQTGSGHVIV